MQSTDSSRKLWVLYDDATALWTKLIKIASQHQGDWITVTQQINLSDDLLQIIPPNKTKLLLGQEYRHAIFDATQGFNLDALARLIGTLVKGSVLILVLPADFTHWKDQDSLRWNENPYPIAVPNFVAHLTQILSEFNFTTEYQFPHINEPLDDLQEQKNTLNQILQSDKQINVLIAKRGRGKSALAGQFTHYYHCIVTAPQKNSLKTFFRFAKSDTQFYAPDELLEVNIKAFPDYLIIDEAAMIPLPMLQQLLQLALTKNCRVLLTTTVEGYEGTGQGFLLKLLYHHSCNFFYLEKPIRWHANDLLEQFSDRLLLNGIQTNDTVSLNSNQTVDCSQVDHHDTKALKQIYYLLKIAHYQTTLVDLRRLLDAQNLMVWQAQTNNQRIAAAITINEGNLADNLIEEVWKGTRRPKGNLVAQSLVAHAGEKLAAKLQSVRINRIAVIEVYRRQHIAKQLVQSIFTDAAQQNKDFLSVSFAFSEDNYRFWTACGFILVHIASHKEACSGSYSVMFIKPITQQAKLLVNKLQTKLQRNWYWLKEIIDLPFNNILSIDHNQSLSKLDLEELRGFCYYYRSYESTYAALNRLNRCNHAKSNGINLPILTALLNNQHSELQIMQTYHLNGRNALMQALKRELIDWFDRLNSDFLSKFDD